MSGRPVFVENDSEGETIEMLEYSWRQDTRLLSRGLSSLAPLREIARGDLAEMVTLAMNLPTAVFEHACVRPVATPASFGRIEIVAMSKQVDFPLSI